MSNHSAQASEAVRDSWDFWLSQHPVSLADIITGAAKAAASEWLASNTDQLLDRIAGEVAKRIPPPGPAGGNGGWPMTDSAPTASACACDRERLLCRCGHPVARHVIASGPSAPAWASQGTFACPVHGWMGQCQRCGCTRFGAEADQ